MSLEVTVEEITPEIAKEYLAKNSVNRPVRRALVAAFVRDMVDGRWQPTGQGISFDVEGNLNDGQHRMHAVLASGTTQTFVVTRGQATTAMKVLDSGAKRTTSDYLGLSNVPNRFVVSAIARLALLYDKEIINTQARNVVSNAEVLDYVEEHQQELERAAELAVHYHNNIPTLTSAMGVAIMLFNRVDPEACMQFFEAMVQQRTNGEGDPRLALMRRLTTIKLEKTRVGQIQILDLFIKSWNAWRSEEAMERAQLSSKIKIRKVL